MPPPPPVDILVDSDGSDSDADAIIDNHAELFQKLKEAEANSNHVIVLFTVNAEGTPSSEIAATRFTRHLNDDKLTITSLEATGDAATSNLPVALGQVYELNAVGDSVVLVSAVPAANDGAEAARKRLARKAAKLAAARVRSAAEAAANAAAASAAAAAAANDLERNKRARSLDPAQDPSAHYRRYRAELAEHGVTLADVVASSPQLFIQRPAYRLPAAQLRLGYKQKGLDGTIISKPPPKEEGDQLIDRVFVQSAVATRANWTIVDGLTIHGNVRDSPFAMVSPCHMLEGELTKVWGRLDEAADKQLEDFCTSTVSKYKRIIYDRSTLQARLPAAKTAAGKLTIPDGPRHNPDPRNMELAAKAYLFALRQTAGALYPQSDSGWLPLHVAAVHVLVEIANMLLPYHDGARVVWNKFHTQCEDGIYDPIDMIKSLKLTRA